MTAATPHATSYAQPFARTDRTAFGLWWWTVDHWLLGGVAALMFLGVALSFASSPAAAQRIGIDNELHFAIRMCIFSGLGAAILLFSSMMSPRGVRRVAFFTFAVSILIMIALPFIGHSAKGAQRWLQLGGFGLQPSEFVKPALVVLASWMFAEGQKGQGVPGVSIAFFMYLLTVGLLLIQPDVGQTVLTTIAFGACFFMAGVPLRWILGLGVVAVSGLVSTYFLFDHVAQRVQKFLGAEAADTTQIDRASDAIAAGGLFGAGPGEGVMKRHVPDLHTDFIYSVGAEEYGLLFSLLLIGLFAFVTVRGLYKAMRLSDPFEQVAAAGLFVLFAQQAFINIAVNLNLIPTKGMTLPFISYGGSSMLAMGLTLGLALALTRKRPGAYAQTEGLAPTRAFQ
ncbi:MAG: putative lipid II flippase FtsW [Caulobacteraceae bacterium]|nr:putative lipid II flippase FtsW [Caulobacteraceae bacterium]